MGPSPPPSTGAEPVFVEPSAPRVDVATPWDEARRAAELALDRTATNWRYRSWWLSPTKIRSRSRIRLPLWTTPADYVARLGPEPVRVPIDDTPSVLYAHEPFGAHRRGGFRCAATLKVPWSWPRLPVWITVDPWWRDHAVISIELRTRRRLRYPRRYWHHAHRALTVLAAEGPPPQRDHPESDGHRATDEWAVQESNL